MHKKKVTESSSHYNHLEKMSVAEILTNINQEDKTVPIAIAAIIPSVEALVLQIVDKMLAGGRLFYIGAGTSGRLGIVDASECVPTYGIDPGIVIGIIAGGQQAITAPVEFAEDNTEQGWQDLLKYNIKDSDVVVGLSASGTTPYVLGALKKCKENNITTASICCNPHSPVSMVADFPIEVVVGPEFVTGSTRMKAGTAQKLLLNMISTSVMIKLGRVEGNKMVHMQLTNEKLVDRGVKMVMEKLQMEDYGKARQLLLEHGSVKKLLDHYQS